MRKTQVAGWFRFMSGDYEVTALYDGAAKFSPSMCKGLTTLGEDELEELLNRDFTPRTPEGSAEVSINAFLVNTSEHLILIDAGKGEVEGSILLDKKGHLLENLEAAGYRAEQVDMILPTHLHVDHICGVESNGEMVFQNATIYLARREKEFWLDTPLEKFSGDLNFYARFARVALEPYWKANRVTVYESGAEIIPHVKSIPLFGHTPGHTGFGFESRAEHLLVWGDFLHVKPVQFVKPEVGIIVDVDSKAAAETRLAVLPKIAQMKMLVAGVHMPFPGIGHVQADAESYRWFPLEYRLLR